MEVVRKETREEALGPAAEELGRVLVSHEDRPMLLLLSGGSSLVLLNAVSKGVPFGSNLTLTALDERYSRDPAVNNFSQIMATDLYQNAMAKGASVVGTRVQEGESMEELASRFDRELHVWREAHPDGVIAATVGIGPDGHVAGIMPHPEDPERFRSLFDSEGVWAVGYEAGEKSEHPLRVTATFPLLRQVAHAVAFVVGEGKREALERVLAQEGSLAETPARILREIADVRLFTNIHGIQAH